VLHLTWKMLTSEVLQDALRKIANSDKINFKSAYDAGKVISQIANELNKAHEKNMELVKLYAQKDDKGNIIPGKVPGEFEFLPNKKEEYNKEMKKLSETEFVVKAQKIDFNTLKDCALTPMEIHILVEDGIVTSP